MRRPQDTETPRHRTRLATSIRLESALPAIPNAHSIGINSLSASGFAKAKVNLAVAYLHGFGVQKNEELAAQLLTQAYQAGNGTAATYLGFLYYFGIGVNEDKVAAEKWFEVGPEAT